MMIRIHQGKGRRDRDVPLSPKLLETVLAKYILKEQIGWQRWVGASVVGCGVLLVTI